MNIISTPPLAAEPIFSIGHLPITNTYLNSLAAVIIILIAGFFIRRKVKDVPRGIQNLAESLLEFMMEYADKVTGDRKKTLKIMPLVGSLFIFIVLCNWMGILPGIGSIGVYHVVGNAREFIPLFRSANADLNLTLAMTVLSLVAVHIMGITAIGFFRYASKYIKIVDLWKALKTLNPTKIMVGFVEFGVGLLEVVQEVTKIISLSLRLFGNIFAGEVLLTVLSGIIAYLVPLPFIALELLVGAIQALIFSMLVLVYATVATTPIESHDGGPESVDEIEKTANALQDEHRSNLLINPNPQR
jgi:F-type H+-transporting ATPase subunit a